MPTGVHGKTGKRDILARLEGCISELENTRGFELLIPEVGSNFVFCPAGAKELGEVAGLTGRIIRVRGRPAACGEVDFGWAPFMGRALLEAHRIDRWVCSAISLRYSPGIVEACRAVGLEVAGFRWPGEGETPECLTVAGLRRLGRVPQVLYDSGAWGLEPLVVIFGPDPETVTDWVKRIASTLLQAGREGVEDNPGGSGSGGSCGEEEGDGVEDGCGGAGVGRKRAVGEAFGDIAPFYDGWYSTPMGRYVGLVEGEAVGLLMPRRIMGVALDVGAGTGLSMLPLRGRGASQVVGVDLSWRMLRVAKERLGGWASLVVADGEWLPFRGMVFSAASAMTVMEFTPHPKRMLRELGRVLEFGGRLVLGVLSSTSWWAVDRRLRNLAGRRDVFSLAWFPSPWRVVGMLREAGFAGVKFRGSVYAPSQTPSRLLGAFARIDRRLGGSRLFRGFGAFTVFRGVKPPGLPR